MTYDVTLIEVNGGIGGWDIPGIAPVGLPSGPFNYLLYSMWCCLPLGDSFGSDGGPAYIFFFTFLPRSGANATTLKLTNASTQFDFFNASYDTSLGNVRSHLLISVDCVTQTVQFYVNDAPVTPASGGWIGGANNFQTNRYENLFDFDIGSLGAFPAFADQWMTNTTGFVDLSIDANRRLFINADLSPVYLGDDGSLPTGAKPLFFQTILPGGAPNDFLINRGTVTPDFVLNNSNSLSFQMAGTCHLPRTIPLTGVSATAEIGALSFPQASLKLVSLYPFQSPSSVYSFTAASDFPSNFSQFSMSVWCCQHVHINSANYTEPYPLSFDFTPTSIVINAYGVDGSLRFSGSWTVISPTNEYQVLFSIDSIAQTYTLFVNGVAPTGTPTWGAAGTIGWA